MDRIETKRQGLDVTPTRHRRRAQSHSIQWSRIIGNGVYSNSDYSHLRPLMGLRTINDATRIEEILLSVAFSEWWWEETDESAFVPGYRIDLHTKDGSTSTYWLGAYSDQSVFPCYGLCSGWWVAPSTSSGEMDRVRKKGLTSGGYSYLLKALDIGAFGRPEISNAVPARQ